MRVLFIPILLLIAVTPASNTTYAHNCDDDNQTVTCHQDYCVGDVVAYDTGVLWEGIIISIFDNGKVNIRYRNSSGEKGEGETYLSTVIGKLVDDHELIGRDIYFRGKPMQGSLLRYVAYYAHVEAVYAKPYSSAYLLARVRLDEGEDNYGNTEPVSISESIYRYNGSFDVL